MGCEIGQWTEWNYQWEIDWSLLGFDSHRGLQAYVKALNRLYVGQPALHQVDFGWEGFQWVDIHDVDNSIVSFIRRAKDPGDVVLLIANFTPVPREGYRVGVPAPGFYRELLNSDAACFGGSNMGNSGGLPAQPTPWQGQPHSILITVPPLAVVFFKPDREPLPYQAS
jgi:1,4-alpha-glucan branching enzyme